MKIFEITKGEIIKQFDDKIMYMQNTQAKYRQEKREAPEYINRLKILGPMIKKLGIDKAADILSAMQNYRSSGYSRMNNSLRASKLPQKAVLIDQYIELAPKARKGIQLYRGLKKEFFQTLKPGMSFVDPAFISVTADKQIANYFAKSKSGGVLVIRNASIVPSAMFLSYTGDEEEYIFPRGLTVKVISIKDNIAIVDLI